MPKLRVAYAPMSKDLTAPGDRRRFSGFALRQDFDFALLEDRPRGNDIVVMTLASDLSKHETVKRKNGAVVIDIVDGYLAENFWSVRRLGRGAYKSISGQLGRPTLRFRSLLTKTLAAVDAVMCASPEQRVMLLQHNKSVFVTVDCLQELFINSPSPQAEDGVFRLLWEGFPENLGHFEDFENELVALTGGRRTTFEILTDLSGSRRRSDSHLAQFKKFMERHGYHANFQPWSIPNLVSTASSCSFGIIPIYERNKMAMLKSENKLLGLWSLGLPVFTSPTPSYVRRIASSPLSLDYCSPTRWGFASESRTDPNWRVTIDDLTRWARSICGETATDAAWMDLVKSLA